ncbi:NADH dehydrogenase [Desulfosarcina ovata subsp. sediminis]|uniref:NADH dehydrogenase n=1 Tax=Desulfosarcina ovata subsp. sediminis TaxID=885957 RepID=A0A5K7ZV47_9BACT|nr:FAD-dependent oxidoreductase [Desulfosarcina ovata]BBO84041.1 NADH dehydrogenase [Desulfosarcina ovata subsp. sediminis]
MKAPLLCTWEGWSDQAAGLFATAADDSNGSMPFKALLGWKGMVVWDETADAVDLLRVYLEKVANESCGQCTPCREGTQRLVSIINRICGGQGELADIDEIRRMAIFVSEAARCDVGRCLAPPTLEILDRFADQFVATVKEKRQVPQQPCETTVTAPCISACPSNVDIPAYVEGIRMGNFAQALARVRQDCPMPGTIGRVCVRPCEASCRRGRLDEPIAIRALKRFLADNEMRTGTPSLQQPPEVYKPERVAIVGAGPAGLSCAYYLGTMGYHTTIFEAQETAGGMATYGIPSYRLPRNIMDYEVADVERMGAEIRYGVNVGEDITLDALGKEGYRAIFLAVGAPESSKMRCEGEDAGYECFMTGIHFLAEVSRGRRPVEGKKLVVVGGGNVAMDCVRSALRTGFTDVNLLYRRTEAEMPADPQEIEEAKEEGVKFHYLVAPVSIVHTEGKVSGLECQRMELGEPDASGRRRPVPVEGSNFVIDCDAIIPAVGQICVVDCVLPEEDSLTRWKTLIVDQMTFQSRTPSVFGGGDCITGPATLIAALAAGKKAARHIAQYIEQGECQPTIPEILQTLVNSCGVFEPDEDFVFDGITQRAEPAVLPPGTRINDFSEVEGCLSLSQAIKESERCLRCYRIAVAVK